MISKMVVPRYTPCQLLALASVAAAAGLQSHAVLSDDLSSSTLHKVASVDSRGNLLPFSRDSKLTYHDSIPTKAIHIGDSVAAHVVRREDAIQAERLTLQSDSGPANAETLLEMKAEVSSGSFKIAFLFLLVSLAMIAFCAGAIHLVWRPLAAMFEERAFEQAAKNALLKAAQLQSRVDETRDAIVRAASVTSVSAREARMTAQDSTGGAVLLTAEERSERRLEHLSTAWATFLEDPVMLIKSSNVIFVTIRELFDKTTSKQFDDLFDEVHAANPEGAPLTDIDHLTKQDFEKMLDCINGSVSGMGITGGRINTARAVVGEHCVFAVADSAQDYDWLFDAWDTVFTEQEPLTKECFAGVVKLVLAWNIVRTLHTARHMREEARRTSIAGSSNLSSKPAAQFSIDLRTGKPPFEARVEIDFEEEPLVPSKEEDDAVDAPNFQGDSSSGGAGASETMAEKLNRRSQKVEEVAMDDGDEPAP
jgi:hypothetical protein